MKLLGNLLLSSGALVILSLGTWMALEAYLERLDSPDTFALSGAIGLGAAMCLLGGAASLKVRQVKDSSTPRSRARARELVSDVAMIRWPADGIHRSVDRRIRAAQAS